MTSLDKIKIILTRGESNKSRILPFLFKVVHEILNLHWDFVLYLEGEEPNVPACKDDMRKAGKMTYAASGQPSNPQVTEIQTEIIMSLLFFFCLCLGNWHLILPLRCR